jgi:AcrR family transcriptional regulator
MDQPTDLRLKKGKQARQSLITAAFQVMIQEGPKGLTAGKITKKAKVSKASLFHYFDSVDDVTFAVLEDVFLQFSLKMSDGRYKTVAEYVYHIGLGPLKAPESTRKVTAAFLHFYQRAAHDESFRKQQEKTTKLLLKNIGQGLEKIIKRPLNKSEQFIAPMLIAMCLEGLGKFCITFKERSELEAAWKLFADSIGEIFEREN